MNECYTGGRMMEKLKCNRSKFIYCVRQDVIKKLERQRISRYEKTNQGN